MLKVTDWPATLHVIASGLMIITAGVLLASMLTARSQSPVQRPAASRVGESLPPVDVISLDDAYLTGSEGARVAIVQFSDFHCPFCRRFTTDTLPAIQDRYVSPGLVRFGFRHMPLPVHALARTAAKAADCAHRQERFWPMHDLLFSSPPPTPDRGLDVMRMATALGLNTSSFEQCLLKEAEVKVAADELLARRIGVTGTPTSFIGHIDGSDLRVVRRLNGARALADFTAALDAVLGGEGLHIEQNVAR